MRRQLSEEAVARWEAAIPAKEEMVSLPGQAGAGAQGPPQPSPVRRGADRSRSPRATERGMTLSTCPLPAPMPAFDGEWDHAFDRAHDDAFARAWDEAFAVTEPGAEWTGGRRAPVPMPVPDGLPAELRPRGRRRWVQAWDDAFDRLTAPERVALIMLLQRILAGLLDVDMLMAQRVPDRVSPPRRRHRLHRHRLRRR